MFGARRSHSGISVTPENYHRCPTAYASVAVIAQAVAQLPLHLFKRTADGGKERATDHPLYDLLTDHPNEWTSSYDFRLSMESSALRYDQGAFAFINRVGGRIEELVQIPSAQCSVELDADTREPVYKVNLLTFGNVAGTVFDRAQVAALDLATRMGGDLQAATLTIGKALNDPVKGLTALGRAGIQFTAQQKEQIKQMVAVGDAAGAQSIMLAELEKQFGGAAKAAGDADAWKPLKTALMDLEGAFEPIVRDVIAPLIAKAGEIVRAFASVSPEVLKFVAVGAAVAAAIGPVLIAFGGLVAAAGAIATAFAGGGVLAGLLPFLGPIGLAAAAVAAAFMIWGDDIVPMLQTFARQLADSIGPKIKPLFEALMSAVKAVGEIFSAIFSMGGTGSASSNLQVFGEIVARVLGAAVEIITGAVNVITNVLRALAALLRGDFSTMWNALGSAVSALVSGVLRAFEALFPGVIGFVRQLVEGVTAWLQGRLGAVLGWVIGKVKEVGDAFFKLYDAVVGHSYIPDMVEEIGDWISKLQGNMVSPVQNMTDASVSAFSGMAGDIDSTMSGLFRSIQSKDWKGVLGGLFDIGGKMGGGIGKVAGIGKSILSAFGGGLPGFKTGGSFTVGGSGGIDSSIVAFRGTPGERVDISTKGQQRQMGGGASIVHVNPSPYFDVQVQRISAPGSMAAGIEAAKFGQHQRQQDQRLARYRLRNG